MGDRFAQEGEAQLQAVLDARATGADVAPVWNKSHREHTLVGTTPDSVRAEADAAVKALGYDGPYFVDADHIGLKTVESFLAGSDFFTLDVAEQVGAAPEEAATETFVAFLKPHFGPLELPGLEPVLLDEAGARAAAAKYLAAIAEAGRIYRHLEGAKGKGTFAAEVSIDETDRPQSPPEVFYILAMIAAEKIPAATIAPRFSGAFLKGVDYVGDTAQFAREFEACLLLIAHAVKALGLPEGLKVSVHSGSDKFSLYPIIGQLVRKHGAGLHLKTAGTTWLEELIGLAEAGGDGLALAKEIYAKALPQADKLLAPYATVTDIDRANLPTAETVEGWSSEDYTAALRHDPANPAYNRDLRQFLHVSFKVAAQLGETFTNALQEHRAPIARNVHYNLLERHLRPLLG